MERISIFNYEAFYLDYLEGNLGEEDTRMLMAFLEEHPECRLEEEELQSFAADDLPQYKQKESLKQVDGDESITLANVEHFLIAEAEGLLNADKVKELEALTGEHPELKKERSRYAAVYFEPDTSLVYSEKEKLKQKRAVILWPYVAMAAAAAVISFVFFITGTSPEGTLDGSGPTTAEQQDTIQQQLKRPKEERSVIVNETPAEMHTASTTKPSVTPDNKRRNQDMRFNDDELNSRPIETILTAYAEKDLVPVTPLSMGNSETTHDTRPQPILAANEMSNPIEPITNFISDKAKTEVDFRRRQATSEKKGGFLLKIGKFSIERNKH